MKPLDLFQDWYQNELSATKASQPSACCLSTIGLDSFPNVRTVALKEVTDEGFIVTGSNDARKGKELSVCNKTALTFWWPATEKQVRVQGVAMPIPDEMVDHYFYEREKDAQLIACIARQGQPIESYYLLEERFQTAKEAYRTNQAEIRRPSSWGGYVIRPVRIEFLQFEPNRLHHRILYERIENRWITSILQP